MKLKSNIRYILILISMCGLIASGVGLMTNIAGLFFTPISEEFGILKGAVSMTLTISNLIYALGGVVAAKVLKEKYLKQLLIGGTILEAGGTILLSLSPNIYMMYILNGIRGLAGGILGFVLVTTVINNWFHENVGLATSIAMSCSGLVGAVFSPIISSVIQSGGWRTGYLVAGILMAVLNLPSIFFLPSIHPHSKNMQALGENNTSTLDIDDEAVEPNISINKILFGMAIIYAFVMCGATALPQHFPGIAESFQLSASTGAMMLSLCMIANTGGKVILGILIDKLGSQLSMLIYAAGAIVALCLFMFIPSDMTMYIGAVLFGLTYALGTVGVVMITKDLFGLMNYSKTYPTISLFGTIGNALFSTLIGFMYDFSQGYTTTLLMVTAMIAMAIAIIVVSYQRVRKDY